MQIVPLQAVPAQQVGATLGNQSTTLRVYEKRDGLYMDVLVDDELIIGGVICHNLCFIVRSAYLGFVGDFIFIDNQGLTDPVYTGLGVRYSLAYLEPSDLAVMGIAA